MSNQYNLVKVMEKENWLAPARYESMTVEEFQKITQESIEKCEEYPYVACVICKGSKTECNLAALMMTAIVRDTAKHIYNHQSAVLPGCNRDVYTGTFTEADDTKKYIYTLAFEPGSKGAGHLVNSFKLARIDADYNITPLGDPNTNVPIEYIHILEELLKGY